MVARHRQWDSPGPRARACCGSPSANTQENEATCGGWSGTTGRHGGKAGSDGGGDMTFDVERLWEEFCPGVYIRLGLHCVEKYVTDDLYDEQAWARFSGGNIVVRLVMERTDLLAFLAPSSHEPKWYVQEIAGWLGEGWVNIPAGDREQFQQLGAFLKRRWTELQELFAE